MSMISSLIDELNKSADEWNGSNMFELARMCREAADTITELRGALQVAGVDYRHLKDENARLRSCLSDDAENARMIMAENAKLREQIHWLKQGDILHVLTDQEYIDQCERERLMQVSIDALDKENAELRELVRDMWGCISHIGEYDVFYYDMAKDGCGISCTVNGEHCCADKLHYRMRELGVEV